MGKIKLFDGTTYNILDYATSESFVIILGTMTASEVLETLTEENLSEIQFLTNSGAVTGIYHNKLLCGHTENGDTLEVSITDADNESLPDILPDPEYPEPGIEPTVWDELDAAYQAGYEEGYTEGVNSAYDQ